MREVHILLVEDDEVDQRAFKRAFRGFKIANPIEVANDGIEALEILRGESGRARLPRPFMIVLDLNMPRMNGIELLSELREDKELHDAIVFVMTTSKDDRDKVHAYEFNVAGYMIKSDPCGSFLEAATMLDHYWRVIEFP